MDKRLDDYTFTTTSEAELISEIAEMEANSEWRSGVAAKELRLEAIEAPIYAMEAAAKYGLDSDLMADTSANTKLLLDYSGQKFMVRDTARPSIGETAKLFGSALGRMGTPLMAETLNNGLSVARGNSLCLMRYGKLSAVHSDADGGYQVMPISRLMEITVSALSRDFGINEFSEGLNSHGCTSASWELVEAQNDILDIYRDALKGAVSRNYAVNMMPCVRFTSSDTATSCARLTPFFRTSGVEYSIVEGLSVKHTKRGSMHGKSGVEAFELGARDLYAQFKACAAEISKLAQLEVVNGTNCVVSLCKRYDIPKKYGEAARLTVERFCTGGRSISAHDVYVSMGLAVTEAKKSGASWGLINNLQESVAKIVFADWAAHDVGGTVSW